TGRAQGRGLGRRRRRLDYDGDGYLDLFVTNMFGASQLYHNVPADPKDPGKGRRFVEVTRDVLGRTSWGAIGCKAFDFNHHGKLDLFLTDMHADMWLPITVPPESTEAARYDLKKRYPHVNGPIYDQDADARKGEQTLADLFKIRYQDVVFGNTLFKRLPGGK